MWAGINDVREEGVFEDLFLNSVTLQPEWYNRMSDNRLPVSDHSDCLVFATRGLIARPCTRLMGYVCQYRM